MPNPLQDLLYAHTRYRGVRKANLSSPNPVGRGGPSTNFAIFHGEMKFTTSLGEDTYGARLPNIITLLLSREVFLAI